MSDPPPTSRPRKAAGPDRLTYFDSGDTDRVMAIVIALVSEVAAIRERLDAHERVAAAGALPAGAVVEAYRPDGPTEAEREAWRDGYIRRLFRVITEDIESLGRDAGPSVP